MLIQQILGRFLFITACLVLLASLSACSATNEQLIGDDPLGDLLNPERTAREKSAILEELPALVESGRVDRAQATESLKQIVWLREIPTGLRAEALRVLIADSGLLSEADSIHLLANLLPTEPDQTVTRVAVGQAALQGWTDLTSAIVRRYATPSGRMTDDRRPERAALEVLHPKQSVEQTVFDVFLASGTLDDGGRLRRDAWNLLSRLDASGDIRVELLGGIAAYGAQRQEDPTLEALRRGLLELRTIPLTGEELEWLVQLADPADPEAEPWWEQTKSVVRTLDPEQLRSLRIRHMEPMRWAGQHQRDWTRVSKATLLEVLGKAIDESISYRRATAPTTREDLVSWKDKLSFGDAVALMTIHDAIREPRVIEAMFEQAAEDAADTTTEYGGVLRLASSRTSRGMFAAVGYPPRGSIREGDTSFVASYEMFNESARALAHYHFHVQRERNARYAGPSEGDLSYAALYGRTCIVLTSIAEGVMNADVYFPSGIVVDLGVINKADAR